jgi:hypothetical protein
VGRHSSFLEFYYNLERLPLSYGDHHVVKKALIKAWRLTLNHGDSLWSYGGSLYTVRKGQCNFKLRKHDTYHLMGISTLCNVK